MIGEIGLAIEKLAIDDKNNAEMLFKAISGFAANFIKVTAPTLANLGIKTISGGLTNADEVTKALSSMSESLVKEQISQYEQSRKTLGNFKEKLSELAHSYANGKQHTPLVIFIDELNRCRPNFAIEVMEKAKHLFNVDNIIFVLAKDKSQLAHSIRAVYGQGLDVNGYLRRFIDFEYLLPTLDISNFFKNLLQKFSLDQILKNIELFYLDKFSNSEYTCLNFSYDLIDLYQLTLSEQEAFSNILNIVLRTHNRFDSSELILLFFLIILKLKFPDIYKTLSKDSMNIFINRALENVQSHSTLVDTNRLSIFPLLESLLLIVSSSNSLSVDTPIVQNYIKKYNLDKDKITFLEKC